MLGADCFVLCEDRDIFKVPRNPKVQQHMDLILQHRSLHKLDTSIIVYIVNYIKSTAQDNTANPEKLFYPTSTLLPVSKPIQLSTLTTHP